MPDRNININANIDLGGAISLEGQDIVLNNNITSGSGSSSIIGKLSGSNFAQTTGGLTVNATGHSTYSGVISGAGSLIKTGTGTLTSYLERALTRVAPLFLMVSYSWVITPPLAP